MKHQKNLPKASIRDQETDFVLCSPTDVSCECQGKVKVLQSVKATQRFLYKFNPKAKRALKVNAYTVFSKQWKYPYSE